MELIIAFLLEKGGIFGLLFLISLAYIWWTGRGKGSSEKKAATKTSDAIETKLDLIITEVALLQKRVISIENNITVGSTTHVEHEKTADKVHESMQHIGELVKDLWDWHNVKDQDGAPIWYVKRALYESIRELTDTMKGDADMLVKHSKALSELNENRVDELKELLTNYNKTLIDLTMALEKIRSTIKPIEEQ
jgi:hypothetical protein